MKRIIECLICITFILFLTSCEKHDKTYNVRYTECLSISTYSNISEDNLELNNLYKTILSDLMNYQRALYTIISEDVINSHPLGYPIRVIYGYNKTDNVLTVEDIDGLDAKEIQRAEYIENETLKFKEKYKSVIDDASLYGKGLFHIRCVYYNRRQRSNEDPEIPSQFDKVLVKPHIIFDIEYNVE